MGDADCTLTASDPEAPVTLTYWQVVSTATPVFFTLAYANAPTTLSSTGDACSTTDDTITVDVPRDPGRNQVTWSFTETAFTIGARPIDSSVYSVPFALSF